MIYFNFSLTQRIVKKEWKNQINNINSLSKNFVINENFDPHHLILKVLVYKKVKYFLRFKIINELMNLI